MMMAIAIHSLWIFGLLYLLMLAWKPGTKAVYGLVVMATGGILFTSFWIPVPRVEAMMPGQSIDGQVNTNIWMWIYGIGFLIQLVRHGLAFRRTYQWKSQGQLIESGYYFEIIRSMASKLQIRRQIQFRLSPQISIPMVVGVIKPVILFPVSLVNQLSQKEVEAILAHELQHIINADYFWNLLLSVLEVVLFFNPFIYLIHRYIILEREVECDRAAADWIGDPILMAKCLLNLEGMVRKPHMAMSIKGQGILSHRINRLVRQGKESEIKNSFFSVVASLTIVAFSMLHIDQKKEMIQYTDHGVYYYNDSITLPGYHEEVSSLEFKNVKGEVKDVYINDEKIENVEELDLSVVQKSSGQESTETNKLPDYKNGLMKKYQSQNPQRIVYQEPRKKKEKQTELEGNEVDLSTIDGYQYGKSKWDQQILSELPPLDIKIQSRVKSQKEQLSFFFDHTYVLGNHKDSRLEAQGTNLLWFSMLSEEYADLSVEEGIVEILTRSGVIKKENFVLIVRPEFILLDKHLLEEEVVEDIQNYILGKNRMIDENDQYQYVIIKNKIM